MTDANTPDPKAPGPNDIRADGDALEDEDVMEPVDDVVRDDATGQVTTRTAASASARKHGVFSRLYHGETRADIVGRWKLWFALSGVFIIAGAIALGTRGLNLGIDFTGGTVWEVPAGHAKITDVRNAIGALGYKDAQVTEITTSSGKKQDCPCIRVVAEASSRPAKATTDTLNKAQDAVDAFSAAAPSGARTALNQVSGGIQGLDGPFRTAVPKDLSRILTEVKTYEPQMKAAKGDAAKVAIAKNAATIMQRRVDSLSNLETAERARVGQAVSTKLASMTGSKISAVTVDTVGPSWGKEISTKARDALIVFLIAITLYITLRFEFRMAVATLAALLHDLVIVIGIYALFGFPVTPATVIAILTILGFSIYDGIVVFDRVDENTPMVGKKSKITYTEMANTSLNQVMMRSLNTSITALLPILSILVIGALILGATTLEEFGLALFLGLLSGAYSSIFIATPLLALLKEREPKYKAVRERLSSLANAPEPALAGASAGGPNTTGLGPAGGAPRPRKPGKKR